MTKYISEIRSTKYNKIVILLFWLVLGVIYVLASKDSNKSYMIEQAPTPLIQDFFSRQHTFKTVQEFPVSVIPSVENNPNYVSNSIQETKSHTLNPKNSNTQFHENRPKMDIMCRTFNGAFFEIMRAVLTILIFFPVKELSTEIVLVFDAENELDHKAASVLEIAYKSLGVKVYFEEPPPPRTLTSMQRDEQFSRTQWSNFYSDLYSNADYIAIIDSDTEFSFRPSIPHHFLIDWKKPVIHGIQVPNRDYSAVRFMIGRDGAGEFMYVFPFVVKREHFVLMRNHVVKTTGLATFEEAWFEMQSRFSSGSWGQFIIMGNYLFHFHHDDYAWDVVHSSVSTVKHPCPHLGKNLPMDQNVDLTVRKYHDQVCVQSRNLASECGLMTEDEVNLAKFVPFTDYWPIGNTDVVYANMVAAKTHDGAAPSLHQDVFDRSVNEYFLNNGDTFWRNSYYNTAERTRKPA